MKTGPPRRTVFTRCLVAGSLACATALGMLATPRAWASAPKPAEIAPALLAKIKLHGKPSARLTVGTQVRVSGHVMNTD